jgi:hypothetical protein
MRFIVILLCFFQFISSCSVRKNSAALTEAGSIKELKFLGAYEVPYNLSFNNTVVGGLSGIDYDRKRNQYYLISDDRSSINASRFYTANIATSESGIDTVTFLGVTYLLMPNGAPYPDSRKDPLNAADPEALRYYPQKDQLIISSEGERIVRQDKVVLKDPFIHIINQTGKYLDSFALPNQARMHAAENGLRQNGTFEGISFAENYQTLYVSIEEPIYEDGHRAGTGKDSAAWIRIIKYNVAQRKPVAQYAYQIDPVTHLPVNPGGFKVNGVSEILFVSNNRLLVVERSFSAGRTSLSIRVYLADLNPASDITHLPSLKNASFKPVNKILLLDMDKLNKPIYNIEGVSFGPLLRNGHPTLIFVADNNFNGEGKNQFLLFEVIPE